MLASLILSDRDVVAYSWAKKSSSAQDRMISIALVLLSIVGSIIVCHVLAERRGSDPMFWGVMAALFGPFAIPLVFLSRIRKETEK